MWVPIVIAAYPKMRRWTKQPNKPLICHASALKVSPPTLTYPPSFILPSLENGINFGQIKNFLLIN